jgi:hypothetical protein
MIVLTRIWHEGHDGNSVIDVADANLQGKLKLYNSVECQVRTLNANTHVLAACTVTDDIDKLSQICLTMLCVGEFCIGEEVSSRISKIL